MLTNIIVCLIVLNGLYEQANNDIEVDQLKKSMDYFTLKIQIPT